MHYVTRISHRMQKHKFGITYPEALFVKSVPVPPEHEKLCVDVSRPRCTAMHYMNHRSRKMQKTHVQHSRALLCDLYWSHPSMRNSESTFRDPDAPECTM
jgi:hypothetical protein